MRSTRVASAERRRVSFFLVTSRKDDTTRLRLRVSDETGRRVSAPRVSRRFAGSRDAREAATRRAGSKASASPPPRVPRGCRVLRVVPRDHAWTPRGRLSRGAGARGIGGGGYAPHDVRVDALGRTQHQVELRHVGLHHRDARAVTHRALSPPREAAVSRLPRRAEAKSTRARPRECATGKSKLASFESNCFTHRKCQRSQPQRPEGRDARRHGAAPVAAEARGRGAFGCVNEPPVPTRRRRERASRV